MKRMKIPYFRDTLSYALCTLCKKRERISSGFLSILVCILK